MSERARFTLQITLRDNHGYEQPLSMAIGLDNEVRISSRAVSDLKFGAEMGFPLVSKEGAVEIMRTKELRKHLFIDAAKQLGTLLAERMEDAEGWHDPERIESARKQLGGQWP